jgi:hypothetical protein
VSDTTGTSAGGAAAPGWYADPHDPQQLRWWSGAAWTEHVSPKSTPAVPEATPAAAQPAEAQPAEAEPAEPGPAEPQPAEPTPAFQEPAYQEPAYQQPEAAQSETPQEESAGVEPPVAPQQPSVPAADPLPSRRALRESAVESTVDPGATPNAWNQPSAATPAADVAAAPSFQQAEPVAPAQPVQPALVEPELTQPVVGQPTADQIAWNQAAQTQAPQPQAAAPEAPVQAAPVQPVAPAQPVQPVQPASSAQDLWNQQTAAPAPDWGQPATAAPASAMDGLFAAPASADAVAPAAVDPAAAPASSQWGLTPSTRRSGQASAATATVGTSTVWMWLVAISPIIAAALIGFAIKTSGIHFDNWMLPAAIVAPYLLVILFAVADRSRLATIGIAAPASWTFAALSAPVYLIARAGVLRRETGKGGPGLIVWLICFVLAIAGFVGYGFIGGAPLIPGLPS